MSENAERSESAETSSGSPTPKRGIPVIGLIALLLVAGTCGWAAYVYITGKDGFDWKRFTFQSKPKLELVAVTGKVYYNDELMTNGIIKAHPVDREAGTALAIGPLKKDGTFKLYTDADGMKEGVYPGEYKFTIEALGESRGASAPPRLLPDRFYDPAQTPVTLTVAKGEKNHFVIKEKGTPIPDSARPKPNNGANRGGGKRPGREEIIKRIFAADKDGDGKISRDEAPDRLKARFDAVDADKDGKIDRKEMESALGRRRNKKPAR